MARNYHIRNGFIFIIIAVFLSSCMSDKEESKSEFATESELPTHLQDIENLTWISPAEGAAPDSVELIRETVFESNDEVFMSGYISSFAVDDDGRMFIVSSVPGNLGIYAFNPDGSYLTTFGRFGRGPGEFEAVGSIDILGDKLILFDPRLQKFAGYSLGDFEKTEEETVKLTEETRAYQISSIPRGMDVVLLNSGEMILKAEMSSLNEESDGNQIFYYVLQQDGTVNPERILEVKRYTRYFIPEREGFALPITKPFNRSSLVSITRSGTFFTAWTEDFLIKEYDANGSYTRSFYYPIERSDFSLDQIKIADRQRRILRGEEIPDTWPALHTMELDDEGRLWVATITDSETYFTWWVLNQKGELIARFRNHGERSSRFVPTKPKITIKNGYFYSHERDIQQGVDRIIKHKVQFIKR